MLCEYRGFSVIFARICVADLDTTENESGPKVLCEPENSLPSSLFPERVATKGSTDRERLRHATSGSNWPKTSPPSPHTLVGYKRQRRHVVLVAFLFFSGLLAAEQPSNLPEYGYDTSGFAPFAAK